MKAPGTRSLLFFLFLSFSNLGTGALAATQKFPKSKKKQSSSPVYPMRIVTDTTTESAAAEKEFQQARNEDVTAGVAKKDPSEEMLKEGITLMKQEKSEDAVKLFRQSRERDPEALASWLYEMYMLKSQNKDADAAEVARLLLKLRPDLQKLPGLNHMLKQGAE